MNTSRMADITPTASMLQTATLFHSNLTVGIDGVAYDSINLLGNGRRTGYYQWTADFAAMRQRSSGSGVTMRYPVRAYTKDVFPWD
jgi:hypothetical protein